MGGLILEKPQPFVLVAALRCALAISVAKNGFYVHNTGGIVVIIFISLPAPKGYPDDMGFGKARFNRASARGFGSLGAARVRHGMPSMLVARGGAVRLAGVF
jgi:hypothetical protein